MRVQRGRRARRVHQELRGQDATVRSMVPSAMSQMNVGISHPMLTSVQNTFVAEDKEETAENNEEDDDDNVQTVGEDSDEFGQTGTAD